jgi:hypothetical protein
MVAQYLAMLRYAECATERSWGALDDVVMGGCSSSGLHALLGGGPGGSDAVVFSGAASTENNGGFASVRSKNFDPALDLGGYEGIRVTLKGGGQRYKLILRTSGAWDAVCYCVSIDPPVCSTHLPVLARIASPSTLLCAPHICLCLLVLHLHRPSCVLHTSASDCALQSALFKPNLHKPNFTFSRTASVRFTFNT